MATSAFKYPTPFNKRHIELEGVTYKFVADEKKMGPAKVPESMHVRKILREVGKSYKVPKDQRDCWMKFFESDECRAILSVRARPSHSTKNVIHGYSIRTLPPAPPFWDPCSMMHV